MEGQKITNMNYIRHLNAFFTHVKTDSRLTCSHISLYMALFQYWNYNRFQNPVIVHREKLMQQSKIGSKNNYYRCLKELHQAGYIFCHSRVSQFHQVKIAIVKLGQTEEKNSLQLKVFEEENQQTPCPENKTAEPNINEDDCLKNNTASVLKEGQHCLKNKTATVLKIGHLYKQNIYKTENSVYNTPTQIFEKNKKISNAINGISRVPNTPQNCHPDRSCHTVQSEGPHPERSCHLNHSCHPERSEGPHPNIIQVQEFFTQNNYPIPEAQKFFYYNQTKNWMLTDKIPIRNWQSLAHKWMLNEKQNPKSATMPNLQTNNQKNYSEPL